MIFIICTLNKYPFSVVSSTSDPFLGPKHALFSCISSRCSLDLFALPFSLHILKLDSSVLVSHDCCNKLPQTEWLKTTEVYSIMALEARIMIFRLLAGLCSLWGMKGSIRFCLFQVLMTGHLCCLMAVQIFSNLLPL